MMKTGESKKEFLMLNLTVISQAKLKVFSIVVIAPRHVSP